MTTTTALKQIAKSLVEPKLDENEEYDDRFPKLRVHVAPEEMFFDDSGWVDDPTDQEKLKRSNSKLDKVLTDFSKTSGWGIGLIQIFGKTFDDHISSVEGIENYKRDTKIYRRLETLVAEMQATFGSKSHIELVFP